MKYLLVIILMVSLSALAETPAKSKELIFPHDEYCPRGDKVVVHGRLYDRGYEWLNDGNIMVVQVGSLDELLELITHRNFVISRKRLMRTCLRDLRDITKLR